MVCFGVFRAISRMILAAGLMVAGCLLMTGSVSAQGAGRDLVVTDPQHRNLITIPPGTRFPITRRITIGLDKSVLIELPVDMSNVLVSNPEVMDAVVQSSRQVYLLAKDAGEANAFFMGPDGQKLMFLEVVVTRDLASLSDALARLLPGSRIKVESVGDNVVLTGSVLNPVDSNRAAELAGRFVKKKDAKAPDGDKKFDNVVNMLSVAAKEQVLLRVQVAEMQRDAIRRLGVNWNEAGVTAGNFTVSKILTNAFPVTASAAPPLTAGLFADATWRSGAQSVTAIVQALERAGLIRTLAEPNLTAISGETAKFLAGGEFPVPVATQDRQIAIVWKQYGVSVSFKPVVMSEGRISLALSAEVSELTNDGAVSVNDLSLQALKVRRSETTLELPSGGTLAMAGLLSDESRQSVEGIPGLKNLPVLGALFRSNEYRRRESELVILVTPYLSTHAARQDFARPDGGYAPSSTLQELFLGHINRTYGKGRLPAGRFEGDYGFIVDHPDPGVKG
jgi:pilus assembly protein CpaC